MTDKTKNQTFSAVSLVAPTTGIILLVLLMLVQGGYFLTDQILPGLTAKEKEEIKQTIEVKESLTPSFYRAIGTVRSRSEIDVIPRIIGRITEVNVRSGDIVKAGDVLARLDAKDLAAMVSQGQEHLKAARATLAATDESVKSAQAALELAKIEMERTRALFERNAAARRDFDQASTAFKQAEAQHQQAIQQKHAATANLAAAQQAILQAEASLSYATITSPVDAIVAERLADPGDLGNPSAIILKLFDPTQLLLEIPVRESLIPEIELEKPVKYQVVSLNQTFNGTIREIVPSVDPHTRSFLVKTCIENSKGLMPGMFGVIEIPLSTQKKRILVPQSAIIKTGQLESVTEVVDSNLLRRQIRTIPAENSMREVISGLKPGQLIIKDNQNN